MIRCYTGTPGSGKSLHSIRKVLDFLADGKNVIANFPIKLEAIKARKRPGRYFYVPNEKITVGYLYQFAHMYHSENEENQTLLLIDEASVKFNCRTYGDKDRLAFCSFFAQHRKFGYTIVLVCQNLRQIDRQIRDLVEIEVIHRKLNNYKFYKILPFPCFVSIEKNLAMRDRNDYEFFTYSKRVGNLYDTFYDFTTTKQYENDEDLELEVVCSELLPSTQKKKQSTAPPARLRRRGADGGAPRPSRTEGGRAARAKRALLDNSIT